MSSDIRVSPVLIYLSSLRRTSSGISHRGQQIVSHLYCGSKSLKEDLLVTLKQMAQAEPGSYAKNFQIIDMKHCLFKVTQRDLFHYCKHTGFMQKTLAR